MNFISLWPRRCSQTSPTLTFWTKGRQYVFTMCSLEFALYISLSSLAVAAYDYFLFNRSQRQKMTFITDIISSIKQESYVSVKLNFPSLARRRKIMREWHLITTNRERRENWLHDFLIKILCLLSVSGINSSWNAFLHKWSRSTFPADHIDANRYLDACGKSDC